MSGRAGRTVLSCHSALSLSGMWHMPDKESAQDATQETFLKLVRFIDRYSHKGQFKAFLYKIAANTCIDILRRNTSPELSLDAFPNQLFPSDSFTEHGFEAAENRQQLAAAMSRLEPMQREIVLLRYGQELSLKEISAITDLPLRTVQTRLRRALKKLNTFI